MLSSPLMDGEYDRLLPELTRRHAAADGQQEGFAGIG
jgi:hypothetical protein